MPVGDVDDAVGNDTGDWSPTDLASLKSAVKHVFTHDTRDSKVVASSGCFVKSVTEAAGILGRGADFARNETQAQFEQMWAGAVASPEGSLDFFHRAVFGAFDPEQDGELTPEEVGHFAELFYDEGSIFAGDARLPPKPVLVQRAFKGEL